MTQPATGLVVQQSGNSDTILIGYPKYFLYNGRQEPRCIQYGEEIARVKISEKMLRDEALVYANLFAAAPELLEALETCLKQMRLEDMLLPENAELGSAIQIAQSAIAKAKS